VSALAALQEAQSPDARLEFVRAAIRQRDVVPALDIDGASLWVPLNRRGMILRDRILSLFAVDFLLRPEDYAGELFVCRMCEQVVFDSAARSLGQCGAHRTSGIVARVQVPDPDLDDALAFARG
jgi:hypothetical protein